MAYYDPNAQSKANGHGVQLQFQDYTEYNEPGLNYTQTYTGDFSTPSAMPANEGSMYTPSMAYTDYENEPPLLEELEINFGQIGHKALLALNPFIKCEKDLMDETDVAGPLLFCLAYGGFLLLTGKLHFGFIYGVAMLGCAAIYVLLSLMSPTRLSFTCVCSVLGYCLLPIVVLSIISVAFSLTAAIGLGLAVASVLLSTWSAARMFVTVLDTRDQRFLVAYPCALLYGIFALMTVY